MPGKPAARAGDRHSYPESDGAKHHKGGPIIEGCQTVLIEGLPAACLGHRARCEGPLDTIVIGSATVFIGGRPAARMGDTTAHGGVIIGGAGTVFIGGGTAHPVAVPPPPSPHPAHPATKHPATTSHHPEAPPSRLSVAAQAKKERRMARLKLITDARAKAATMKDPERSKVLKAASDFRQNMDAAEMAALSRDSYHYFDKSIKGPPVGYLRGSENPKYLPVGVTPAMLAPEKSHFRAEVYFPDKEIFGTDDRPIVVYKGTTLSKARDLLADIQQSRGLKSDYYERAVRLARNFKAATKGNFVVAGHSLGGGEASAAGIVTGARTFTFNPAGLHPNTIAPYGKSLANGRHVNDYIVDGEALNTAQDNSGVVGVAMLGIYPAIGADILAHPLPRHVGRSFSVPGNVNSHGQRVSQNPCAKHSIDTVIDGIEALKARNQRELQQVVERR